MPYYDFYCVKHGKIEKIMSISAFCDLKEINGRKTSECPQCHGPMYNAISSVGGFDMNYPGGNRH